MSEGCRNTPASVGCACTWEPCPRKGHCCDCIAFHRRLDELPGCLFPAEAERSYDRSTAHYLQVMRRRG